MSLKRLRAFAAVLRAAWIEYERDRASYFAVAMVYYALVSLVPLLLLLLAALGLLLRFAPAAAEAQRQMLEAVEARFGPELSRTITGLLDALQRESIIATAIGLVGLLFAASVLFRHLRLTFRAIWKLDPPLVAGSMRVIVWKSFLERAVAFGMVMGGGAFLLAALALIGLAQWLDRTLGELPILGPTTGWLLSAAASLILAVVTFAFLFKFLPPVPLRWRDVRLAALLCAVGWVATSELLALYGVVFESGWSPSGALGAVLAVMLWMNVVSKVLFFGAEVCKVVATQGGGGRSSSLRECFDALVARRSSIPQHLVALRLNVRAVQALASPVRRAPHAGETVAVVLAGDEDRVVPIAEVSEVRAQVHEALVGEQLDSVAGLGHPERGLQGEQARPRLVQIVRSVNGQGLQQRPVPGGKPEELVKRVTLRGVRLDAPVVCDVPFGSQLGEIHELVGGDSQVEEMPQLDLAHGQG